MHKLMCVIFSSNCVKSTTFFILHNYGRADVIALIAHYLNKIIIIDIYVQFIIVTFYDELITNKVL